MNYTIINRTDDVSKDASNYIDKQLSSHGFKRDDIKPKIIIVVGGDGTFLVAAHKYLDIIEDTIMVGMHTGTLGFFADFELSEIDYLIECIIHKEPKISTKRLLDIKVVDHDETEHNYYALNEARIENIFKTQILKVWIDQVYLETFRGTGICVSTQPGSTGYNRSLRGAVISDDLELIQMAEITGIHHRLFQSLQVPLILSENSNISFASPSFVNSTLCYDHLSVEISDAKYVFTSLSETKKINFARYHKDVTYIHRIKSLF